MNHGIFQDGISYSDFALFLEDVWNPHLLNKILENEIFMIRTRYVFSVTFLMNCQLFLGRLLRGGWHPLPLGEPFSERFTPGPGCLAVDDGCHHLPHGEAQGSPALVCIVPISLLRTVYRSDLSGMCESLLKRDTKEIILVEKRREVAVQGYQGKIVQLPSEVPWQKNSPP